MQLWKRLFNKKSKNSLDKVFGANLVVQCKFVLNNQIQTEEALKQFNREYPAAQAQNPEIQSDGATFNIISVSVVCFNQKDLIS